MLHTHKLLSYSSFCLFESFYIFVFAVESMCYCTRIRLDNDNQLAAPIRISVLSVRQRYEDSLSGGSTMYFTWRSGSILCMRLVEMPILKHSETIDVLCKVPIKLILVYNYYLDFNMVGAGIHPYVTRYIFLIFFSLYYHISYILHKLENHYIHPYIYTRYLCCPHPHYIYMYTAGLSNGLPFLKKGLPFLKKRQDAE